MKVTGTDGKEYTVEPDANSSGADLWRANLSKSIGGRSDGTLCAFSYTVGHFEIQLSSICQKNNPILLISLLNAWIR